MNNRLLLLFFGVLACFPLFYKLDQPVVKNWVESLFGIRVMHLAMEGRLLETFKEYPPLRHDNLKPPFTTLLQLPFWLALAEANPALALRLPIALIAMGLVFSLRWLSF